MGAVVLLLATVGHGPDSDRTELVEVNHCYNRQTGERRFIQVIYWGSSGGRCLHVREWHMLDRCHAIHIVPTRRDHPYSVLRGAGADVRIVHARQVKITHTFDDPEESDRRLLPVASRQPLGK